jgi:hypothetical protein
MTKLEKNSDNEIEVEPIQDEPVAIKEKKPRSQKQIDACINMRKALQSRKDDKLRLKEETRLEHEAMQLEIARKLDKLKKKEKISKKVDKKAEKKVNEKLQQKLNELVSESESDESSVSSEEIVIKKKTTKKAPVREVETIDNNRIKVNFF